MGRTIVDLEPFEKDMIDSLVMVAYLNEPDILRMNIEFIDRVLQEKCPVAIGIILGDWRDLFENVLAKLEADNDGEGGSE